MTPSRRVERAEGLVVWGLVFAGLALTTIKAYELPITTDEAWSFNAWTSLGFDHIWRDYSHTNNHIFYNICALAATKLFGDGELALRSPSLFGHLLMLASYAWCRRELIRSRALRIGFLLALCSHPYLIDFGACARGYSLSLGALSLSLAVAARLVNRAGFGLRRSRVPMLVTISGLLGLSVACVPLALLPALGLALAVLALCPRPPDRSWWAAILLDGLALACPAALIASAVYVHAIPQVEPGHFWYGTESSLDSVRSLHQVLVYTPQALVDGLGNPMIRGPFQPWKSGWLPESVHGILASDAGLLAGAGLGFAALALTAIPGHVSRATRLVAPMIWVYFLAFAARIFIGGNLPVHRIWLPVIPALIALPFLGLDRLLMNRSSGFRRATSSLLTVFIVTLSLRQMDRIDLSVHREWPDNAPILPSLVAVSEDRDGETVSVGYVWYQHSCLTYYRHLRGWDWLYIPPTGTSSRPRWDYILVNNHIADREFPGYETMRAFDGVGSLLLRRRRD